MRWGTHELWTLGLVLVKYPDPLSMAILLAFGLDLSRVQIHVLTRGYTFLSFGLHMSCGLWVVLVEWPLPMAILLAFGFRPVGYRYMY